MKKYLCVLVLLSVFAHARGGGIPIPVSIATEEELHRISDVEVNIPGQESRNLGYKTTSTYLFSTVGMWISNDGYVLIPKNSNQSYSELTEEKIKLLNELELLPKDLPESPSMSLLVLVKGFALWISLFALILLVVMNSRRKKKKLNELLAGASDYEKTLIDVMGLMAYSDGKIKDDEKNAIKEIFREGYW